MRQRQIWIELYCLARELVRLVEGTGIEKVPINGVDPGCVASTRQNGVGAGIVRVYSKRLVDETSRFVKIFLIDRLVKRAQCIDRLQVVIICLPTVGRLDPRPFSLGLPNMCGEDCDDRAHNLVRHGENVFKLALVTLSPAMGARCRVNQLRGDANTITAASYAPL